MKATVFSTRKDERLYLEQAFTDMGVELEFEEVHLNAKTAELAKGSSAVLAFVNDSLDRACLERLVALNVKVVALRCAGFNNVDLDAAHQLGIAVVRVPAYSPYAVAEHALTLMLSLNRHLHKAYNRVREGNFLLDGLVGRDVHGKTVGVIGTGQIGTVFCRLLSGFGSRVLAYDPLPSSECLDMGVEYVDLSVLISESDFISLHCPLGPETRHIIDQDALAKIKSGAMLINTSRGGLVDTAAVIGALKDGSLGGLAIDVYEEEADLFFEDFSDQIITDDQLMRLTTFPNVIITGHQAFLTQEALHNIASISASNIQAVFAGNECPNSL